MTYSSVEVDSGTGIPVHGDVISTKIIQSIKTLDPTEGSISPIGNSANPWSVKLLKASSATTSLISVTTSNTLILATNLNRKGAFLRNISDTQINIALNSTAIYATSFPCYPGETFIIPDWYSGDVAGIHTGTGTKDVLICEG